MYSTYALLALAIGLAGCGATRAQQKPPFFKHHAGDGMCDSTTIVDSTGLVAREHGCEQGSSGWKVHRMSALAFRRVQQAFGCLPAPGSYGQCQQSGWMILRTLSVEQPGQAPVWWAICDGAPAPIFACYKSVQAAMNAK